MNLRSIMLTLIFGLSVISGCIEGESDIDEDGVSDELDNCPEIKNPGQINSDNDVLGDECDEDDDNDGWDDQTEETCGSDPKKNHLTPVDTDGDRICDYTDTDDDNDGINDIFDALPRNPNEYEDTDEDGIGDNEDTDDDNDGFSDEIEIACESPPKDWRYVPADYDNDGTCNVLDSDGDGDGVENSIDYCEWGETGWTSSRFINDWDMDGCNDDIEDPDDDNDGLLDTNEWADYGNGWLSITSSYFEINYSKEYDDDGTAPDIWVRGIIQWYTYYYTGGCTGAALDMHLQDSNIFTFETDTVNNLDYTDELWLNEVVEISDDAVMLCIQFTLYDEDEDGISEPIYYDSQRWIWSMEYDDLNEFTESHYPEVITQSEYPSKYWYQNFYFDERDNSDYPYHQAPVAVDFTIGLLCL